MVHTMDSDHLQKVAYMRQFSLLAAYAFCVIQNMLAINYSTSNLQAWPPCVHGRLGL